MNVEARTLPDAERSRRVGRVLLAALAALALAGVGAMAVSERGLTGTIDHQIDVFTTAKQDADRFDPARLLTTNSGNRWVWWEEAAGGWSDRPFQGWGAGSFALLHRRYRENDLDVLQPHSVPLQFLSETGLLGALLGLGGLGLLGAAALGTVRRLPGGRERGLAAALFAGAGASAIQGLYEWNWDIPAATLPALIFAGVLAGARTHARAQDTTEVPRPPTTGLKLGVLAAATLLMCTVAISAGIPSWADSKADSAILAVSGKPSPQELADAEAEAELAARLDPLAVDPLFTASTIAGRRGHPRAARKYVVEAITRQPDNPRVWLRLASVGAGGGQGPEARFAIRKALALDPRNKAAIGLASLDLLLATPPEASATATGTPLPTIIPQLTPEQIGEFLSTGKLPPGYPKYDLPGSPTG